MQQIGCREKSGHHNDQIKRHIAKDAGLLLKYSDLVNAGKACSVCPEKSPWQMPKESGAVHWSFQPGNDWQIDYGGPFPLNEGSNMPWYVGRTTSGLRPTFPVAVQTKLSLSGD